MSKTTAAFYGLLAGGITPSVFLNGAWLIAIIGVLAAIPTIVRRMRARRRAGR